MSSKQMTKPDLLLVVGETVVGPDVAVTETNS